MQPPMMVDSILHWVRGPDEDDFTEDEKEEGLSSEKKQEKTTNEPNGLVEEGISDPAALCNPFEVQKRCAAWWKEVGPLFERQKALEKAVEELMEELQGELTDFQD
ncbi:unnamed protein product [Phytomonas sp. Hart1]|nr:unnamed protein product [Phytomonas sp. Hart1]|eukprot:CCW70987.1 unnamed protein product [Phytomonas sp. isolate Hart1]